MSSKQTIKISNGSAPDTPPGRNQETSVKGLTIEASNSAAPDAHPKQGKEQLEERGEEQDEEEQEEKGEEQSEEEACNELYRCHSPLSRRETPLLSSILTYNDDDSFENPLQSNLTALLELHNAPVSPVKHQNVPQGTKQPFQEFEINRDNSESEFMPCQDPNASQEVKGIFDILFENATKGENEGPVLSAGVKIFPSARFFYKVVEVSETVTCEHCRSSFRDEMKLRIHMKKMHAEVCGEAGLKECPVCKATFQNEANLVRHITSAHAGEAKFFCDACPASFSHKLPYTMHLRERHAVVPASRRRAAARAAPKPLLVWKCCTCSEVLANRGNLQRHIELIHLNVRVFRCENCGKEFGTHQNRHCHLISSPACRAADEKVRNWSSR